MTVDMLSSITKRLPWTLKQDEADEKSEQGPGPRPWALQYRSSKSFIVFAVAMGVFTDIFLYAVIVPVVPFSLTSRIGINESSVQSWISILVAVYGAALAVFSPFVGWAADRSNSRQFPLILGLLALGGATILLNVGTSIGILVLGRILQGLSAAVVWIVGLALVADTVGRNEVAETMGYVFLAMSLAYLLGPLLGGIVFEKAGYNAVFAMCYGLIGMDIGLRLLLIEKKVAKKWMVVEQSDVKMADSKDVKETEDLEMLPTTDHQSPSPTEPPSDLDIRPFYTPPTTEDEDKAPAVTAHTTSTRSVPKFRLPPVITLLKSYRLLTALWATLAIAILLTQFDSVLALYVESTFGWTSTGAGLIFLPIVLPSFVGPGVGWISDRYGGRWMATVGFLLAAPAEALLRYVDHDTLSQKVLLCALLALLGLFINMIMTPVMSEIMLVVAIKEEKRPGIFGDKGAYAQAYGLFNLFWAFGSTAGPLWAGYVNGSAGWGTLTWSIAILAGLSAVPVFIWTDGSIFKQRRRRRQAAAVRNVVDD